MKTDPHESDSHKNNLFETSIQLEALPQKDGKIKKYWRQALLQLMALTSAIITIYFAPLAIAMPFLSIIFIVSVATVGVLEIYKSQKAKLEAEKFKTRRLYHAIQHKALKLYEDLNQQLKLAKGITPAEKEASRPALEALEDFCMQFSPSTQRPRPMLGILGSGRSMILVVMVTAAALIAIAFIPGVSLSLYSLLVVPVIAFVRDRLASRMISQVKKSIDQTEEFATKYQKLLELEKGLSDRKQQLSSPQEGQEVPTIEKLLLEALPVKAQGGSIQEGQPTSKFMKNIKLFSQYKIDIVLYSLLAISIVMTLFFAPILTAIPCISIMNVLASTASCMYADYQSAEAALNRQISIRSMLTQAKLKQEEHLPSTHANNPKKTPLPQPPEENEPNPKLFSGIKITIGIVIISTALIGITFVPGINLALYSAAVGILAGMTRTIIMNNEQAVVRAESRKNIELTQEIAQNEVPPSLHPRLHHANAHALHNKDHHDRSPDSFHKHHKSSSFVDGIGSAGDKGGKAAAKGGDKGDALRVM